MSMAGHDVQQQLLKQKLPALLRDVYEGRLRIPEEQNESWDAERRLGLFESISRRRPVGTIMVWRTSQDLVCRTSIGPVPLREPPERRVHDYLVEGIGLVEALFLELGHAFWRTDEPAQRRLSVAEPPATFVTFELGTETFRICRTGDALLPVEFPVSHLLDPEWQHAFSATLRPRALGPQLQARFSRLVDAFFDAALTVIRMASDDSGPVREFLEVRRSPIPRHLLTRGPETTRWYCDTCGQAIRHPRDGWVEWLVPYESPGRIGRGLRLVHHLPASPLPQGCQYDQEQESQRDQSMLHDVSLVEFLGHDGLTYLLEVLSRGELPQAQVVEMIKRLHTPGYERARFHARAAADEGVIEPNMAPDFYSQRDISAVLDWADAQGRKP